MDCQPTAPHVRLLIGDLCVTLVGNATLCRAAALPGLRPFLTNTPCGKPTLEVRLDQALPMVHCQWLTTFNIVDGNTICRFGRDAEGCYHYSIGDNVRLYYNPHHPNEIDITPITDLSQLSFSLWLAYALLALPYGRMPIHSSAIEYAGHALLCLGESGTGKSTHTRLWIDHIAGSQLLNDDSPILAVSEDEVRLFGSPWSGKTPCYRQASAPVAAIVRLEQKPNNDIRRLPTLEAFAALQPSCPPSLSHDEQLLDHIVELISTIIRRTPIFRLGCRPDTEAAQLCHNAIFGQQ